MSRKTRLQKYLSDAGVASRRHSEELILDGRVLVNNEVVDTIPAFVDPDNDKISVNGMPVRRQKLAYYMVNKPKSVVCTNRDPQGRVRAVDLLPPDAGRLFPVGRLDADSTGLLLMTNDGELAETLSHPRYGVAKTYRAEVRGRVAGDLPEQLKAGVRLAEGKAHASDVELVHVAYDRSILMITLREGRNRQVRRMLAKLGHRVKTLKRVQFGPLTVRRLPVGAARPLTPKELDALREEAEDAVQRARRTRRRRKPGSKKKSATQSKKAPPRRSTPRRADDEGDRPGRRIIT